MALAVIIARNEPQNYPGIGKAVRAILFLGTPHQGSTSAEYATILARTANVLVIRSQVSRFIGPMRTDLLKTLQRHKSETFVHSGGFQGTHNKYSNYVVC